MDVEGHQCLEEGSSYGRGCQFDVSRRTFRDSDGALVIGSPAVYVLDYASNTQVEIRCGDQVFGAGTLNNLDVGNFVVLQPEVLTFGDGSALRLFPEVEVDVGNWECIDRLGRWEGTAGSYDGRTGTYREIHTTLQIELTLTESP
jgi:hypothetical protein